MNPGLRHLGDWRCALALGFGSGLLRPAPGTWGTLAALPVAWALMHLSPLWCVPLLLAAAGVGIHLCGYTAGVLGVHDHPAIVWDEFVGVWLAVAFLPPTWLNLLLGFCLFRLFDILKPWPIGWLDKQVSGGLGIMLDDALAGIAAAAILIPIDRVDLLVSLSG